MASRAVLAVSVGRHVATWAAGIMNPETIILLECNVVVCWWLVDVVVMCVMSCDFGVRFLDARANTFFTLVNVNIYLSWKQKIQLRKRMKFKIKNLSQIHLQTPF
jgi:hypothetical protein